MPTIREMLEGAVWGLLVGDALGVPYEFHPADSIPPENEIEFAPPPGFARSHAGVPPGTWSDDGAHALCLLASLLYCGRLDVEDLMRRLTNWYELGYMAVGGIVFDVGMQTAAALAAFRNGTPAAECGGRSERDNGNGSLMRVLPLALWHQGSDEELVRDARRQSVITHGHMRAQLCCALYCLWARRILEAHPQPWPSATGTLRAMIRGSAAEETELLEQIRRRRTRKAPEPDMSSTRFTQRGRCWNRGPTRPSCAPQSASATIPTPRQRSPAGLPAFAKASSRSRRAGGTRCAVKNCSCRCSVN